MAYGIKIFGPGGTLRLDDDETFTRVVATVKQNASFSGTFSVPDFDDTKGMFHVSYFINKYDGSTSSAVSDSTPLSASVFPICEGTSLPTLNWNNTTKVMTCSPVVWPSGWTTRNPSDYVVTFIHYR